MVFTPLSRHISTASSESRLAAASSSTGSAWRFVVSQVYLRRKVGTCQGNGVFIYNLAHIILKPFLIFTARRYASAVYAMSLVTSSHIHTPKIVMSRKQYKIYRVAIDY